MPGKSGIDLEKEIGRRWPGLPVILTTGYSDAATLEGSDGRNLLLKPYRPEALAATVRQVLHRDQRL